MIHVFLIVYLIFNIKCSADKVSPA